MGIEVLTAPMVEGTKEYTGFITPDCCIEWCSHCEEETYNIPTDLVSLCAHCGEELFPCSKCDDKCDWNDETLSCHRFKHSGNKIDAVPDVKVRQEG